MLLDDRLLVESLLGGLPEGAGSTSSKGTTSYWYYRACRAVTLGAGGHLSGPFEALPSSDKRRMTEHLLELSDDIALPDPRATVPAMAKLAANHPRLNLLNLAAVAAAKHWSATVWLSAAGSSGVLLAVLDAESIAWRTVTVT